MCVKITPVLGASLLLSARLFHNSKYNVNFYDVCTAIGTAELLASPYIILTYNSGG